MMNVERSNQTIVQTNKQTRKKYKSQISNAKQNNNNHKHCNRKTDKKEDFMMQTLTSTQANERTKLYKNPKQENGSPNWNLKAKKPQFEY